MRFDKGHKFATRDRIIKAASMRFRRDGIAASGIAGVMEDAGLTHGGFYAHFSSKEDLVGQATNAAIEMTNHRLERLTAQDSSWLTQRITHYLSASHRDHPATGCAVAALVAELGRHGAQTRAIFTEKLAAIFAAYAAHLPPETPETLRGEKAIGIFAVMLGGLQLARAVADPDLSNKILDAASQAAHRLAA
ncbi:MAG: TetR/AcrR family transcriptional regulator [Acidocella sp.]|nr:TetR/AcrR family transcriptional regulator [Acidocella sp.]